jgi:hypothetical protein
LKEKDGKYSVYRGKAYKSYYDIQLEKMVLVSHDSKDLKNDFIELHKKNTTYIKYVPLTELEDAYILSTMALYKGKKVGVTRLTEEEEPVIMHGDNDFGNKYGFKKIEQGVWEKIVREEELETVWQMKRPILGF